MHLFLLVITISILLSSTIPSFAQVAEPLITASTDKLSYKDGDMIVISGSVKAIVEGTPLTIQILDPNRNIVQVAQIDVAQDGKYTTSAKASGALWKKDGTYTVKVQYGPPNVVTETNFEFASATSIAAMEIFEVNAGNEGTFDVEYNIRGGTVKDMIIDFEGLALIINIESASDGTITLKIPRALIDAKTTGGEDDTFIILIDGAEVDASQTATTSSRTLTINFLEGDSDIEIIGTHIVPEFGAIAALVLAVAIISIIALSAKTRLRLMPKY
ncbi:MAG TPA: PEFG-CTERM sorting domain-containing protein [Nitrosopumilaceae archaeon]|nr:PEFG-CTERM sorting domain-containing protein [Nitrosopumilaceae archaeon]